MRTRYKKMEDYGVTEDRRLFEQCKYLNADERLKLFRCAIMAAPGLEIAVYESLTTGIGYRTITKLGRHIPAKEDDFYAYRRKTLAMFSKCGEKPVQEKMI